MCCHRPAGELNGLLYDLRQSAVCPLCSSNASIREAELTRINRYASVEQIPTAWFAKDGARVPGPAAALRLSDAAATSDAP